MNQSTIIALSILFAFFVFVTTRGELPAYLQILL